MELHFYWFILKKYLLKLKRVAELFTDNPSQKTTTTNWQFLQNDFIGSMMKNEEA